MFSNVQQGSCFALDFFDHQFMVETGHPMQVLSAGGLLFPEPIAMKRLETGALSLCQKQNNT